MNNTWLLAGGIGFGSHLIDPKPKKSDFVVQSISTGKTVRAVINIATYLHDVCKQMKKIESVEVIENSDCTWPEPPCKGMDKFRNNDYRNVPEAISTHGGHDR
ncbi:MAG: hypothetical protein A3H31_04700 [Gallionellales bacterium RIFCSPLOWO2_02_FULL_57_47]|nr:MAG: hypothetical protein A3H31_04700 [Gallionellales bacterium RIFCSPLOWO2_02_FULL_57_47]OGT16517.1 MAG: hypothetical protein A3J49_17800 [Gallionellales bacterium RIFCSPHIGHO2_02_FULL_57_16]